MSDPTPTSDSATPAVQVRDLRVDLAGTEILHDVDLTVTTGQVVAIMGSNGSGKSTLVRTVVGAIPATSGAVSLFGAPYSHAALASIGYVPQRITAAGGVAATAMEVVASGVLGRASLLPARGTKERARRALEAVGIGHLAHREVSRLSGGEQQRVLIARALVREPNLLILDEPMAGVDLPSQETLASTLADHKSAGGTIVIVLHELGLLADLIDHAVVLDQGCVTHVGPPPRMLGEHALPGHAHVHPHPDPPEPPSGPIDMEVST